MNVTVFRRTGMPEYDFIVIGGGPAGLIAAGHAGERGRRVLLLERGPSLGRKLLLTGGGRCNVTNSASTADFIRACGPNGASLRTALSLFGSEQLLEWLHQQGVETVEEENGCVFPARGGAGAVLGALTAFLRRGRVDVLLNHRAEGLSIEGGKLKGVSAGGRSFAAGAVLVATGGLSYPQTGSTGDGYAMARQAGHKLTPPYPAVGGLETAEKWPGRLQGTPAGIIGVRARAGRRILAAAHGPAVWTHYGVSGPAVLDVSSAAVRELLRGEQVVLELDLVPDKTQEQLEGELMRAGGTAGRQTLRAVLARRLPRRTASLVLELGEIDPEKRISQCSRAERRVLAALLKHLRLGIARPRPVEEATVTGGGVTPDEIDPRKMESRLLRGLYLAGEVLDLHGPCGGYNLQAAFATGYLAGHNA